MKAAVVFPMSVLLIALNAPAVSADPVLVSDDSCLFVLRSMSFGSLQPVIGLQQVVDVLGGQGIVVDATGMDLANDGFVVRNQPYQEVAYYHFMGVNNGTYEYWVTGFSEQLSCVVADVIEILECLVTIVPTVLNYAVDKETQDALNNVTDLVLPPGLLQCPLW